MKCARLLAQHARSNRVNRSSGFTLVELMVAMVIGLAIVLALMTVTARFESGKRQNGASSDLALNIGFVAYDMDRQIRSAGSGYLQSYQQALGCTLNVSLNNAQLLPSPAAFPAPFDAVPQAQRMIPALIYAGLGAGGSDILAVKSGTSGIGEAAIQTRPGSATATQLNPLSTLGLRANDMLLMIQSGQPCMLTQVASTFTYSAATSLLPLGGSYYSATVNGAAVTNYSGPDLSLLNLGNVGADNSNPPQMMLYGVGPNSTLFSYDILQATGSGAAIPQADGVVDMRALYGVDADGDGNVDTWVTPSTAGYTAGELNAGTAAAQLTLTRIRAVRVGLIMRSDRIEKTNVSPASLTLFSDLPATVQYTRAVSSGERLQKLRVVEFTVPLRNVLLLPKPPTGTNLPTQATP